MAFYVSVRRVGFGVVSELVPYLERAADGVLQVGSGPYWGRDAYKDPGEAVRTWWAGGLRFGCTHSSFSKYLGHPCGNAAKHDPDHNGNPTKCGHHSQAALERKAAKKAERDAKWKAELQHKKAVSDYYAERDEIIVKIAEGHNDPRGLCQDWLDRKPQKGSDI